MMPCDFLRRRKGLSMGAQERLSLEQRMARDGKRVPRGAFSFVCNCPKVYFSRRAIKLSAGGSVEISVRTNTDEERGGLSWTLTFPFSCFSLAHSPVQRISGLPKPLGTKVL